MPLGRDYVGLGKGEESIILQWCLCCGDAMFTYSGESTRLKRGRY
jgi:hypothetical protein